jgi:Fucosyltransferase, N-terminal/Glycosyltransferase family 10 (fucosyltransferase) C-term
MTISLLLLFSISITLQNHSLYHLNLFRLPYEQNLPFTNQSTASSLTYEIETTEFYPYLPIQIFTENRQRFLQLKNPRKQLILLATPFFDDPIWTMNSLRTKTNAGNSTF